MPAKKEKQTTDLNTEQKIKAAAKIVFHKKGFAAARTRDIAEEAGMNTALLNYYFRSKEKLFQLIMFETISGFMQNMGMVFNDDETTFEKKVELLAENYIDLFLMEPEIPLFVMSEIRSRGAEILERMPAAGSIMQSVFIKQFKAFAEKGKIMETNPLHFMMNLMSMIVFPFIGSPILKMVGKLKEQQFEKLMQERKKLIPVWVKAILKANKY
ncbi:MAG TPA: TetR/AcrR family transcriptional regulator [Puia sp.]|jgi:AcrR family transcriptional regulator